MALQIIEKYRKPEAKQDDYVFPILDRRIHKTAIQIRDKVRKANKAANKALHRIGEKLGDDLAVILFFIVGFRPTRREVGRARNLPE